MDTLLLWWKKFYLWIALGCVLLLVALLFFRKGSSGQAKPREVETLEAVGGSIRKAIAKADSDAAIVQIRAEAKEQAIKDQVDQIEKMDDEFEKLKLLVQLKKSM